jgi:hypothetical protein
MPVTYTFTDPVTGNTVTYVNPWTYDPDRVAWIADDVAYVSGNDLNNLLRFGQPFDPSNHLTGRFYRDDLEGLTPALGPNVIFSQENVQLNGFGRNITLNDFDVVKKIKAGDYNHLLQEGRTYTLAQLQALGISPVKIGELTGKDVGDHMITTDLYWDSPKYPGAEDPAEMMYIFGSVQFRLSADTTFTIVDGQLIVNGSFEIEDDNFNHLGGRSSLMSALVQLLVGDVAVYERVAILYEGQGLDRRVVAVIAADECFAADTPVMLADRSTRPIADIRPGDIVLSYDVAGALVPGRVTRTSVKEAAYVLDVHGLTVTPGHVTLCGDGVFKGRHVPIIDILLSDGALVRADGSLVRMATNAPVGSVCDRFVQVTHALTPEDAAKDSLVPAEMRVGTLLFDRDGVPVSVLDCLTAADYAFDPDTGLVARPGEAPHPLDWFGPLPRPEDYVLARSQATLEALVADRDGDIDRSQALAGRLRALTGDRLH